MEVPEYFEKLVNSELKNVNDNQEYIKERLDQILTQTTLTNGRVRELENWRATSQGHWSVVTKIGTIGGGLLGGVLGYIANKIW